MILSKFIRVMDISWQDFLWGSFWVILFIGVYTSFIIYGASIRSRARFIKNELPTLHNHSIEKLNNKIKELETKLKDTEEDLRFYYESCMVFQKTVDDLKKKGE